MVRLPLSPAENRLSGRIPLRMMTSDPGAPLVSVVMPTCFRPALVIECVRSILQNGFDDFEIVIVDQDPSGGLAALLAQTFGPDPRIRHFTLDEAAADRARNMGLDHARGRLLVFVDDDVEVERGWLQAYVDAFASVRPEPGAIAGRLDARYLAPKPSWLPESHIFGVYHKGETLGPIVEGDLPISANCAFLRDAVDKAGRFDERIDYSYARARTSMITGGDSLMALRIRQAGYSIYYQPTARAWHKISKAKLTLRWVLRRSYWDGVTHLIVLFLSGAIVADQSTSIIRWHLRSGIGDRLKRFVFPKPPERRQFASSSAWMQLLAECLKSSGVIRAAWKLKRTGELP